MKLNVLKQASLPDALIAEPARRHHLVELTALTDVDFRALADAFTMLITSGEATVTRELIASLPALELIAVFGVGYDGMGVQAAAKHQVRVSHTSGVLTDDVADLALDLMLATSQQIVAAHKSIEAGKWVAGGLPRMQKVSDSRVDTVGMRRIDQAIARCCEGFAIQIVYHGRRRLPALNYAWREDLLTLAAENDLLVICTPRMVVNRGLTSQLALVALGEKGILIDISRGNVIDEPALVVALESGITVGVGLDVFSHEPAVPAGLLQRSNAVVTPHTASAIQSTRAAMAQLVLDNVVCWAEKKVLATPVTGSLAD